MAYPSDDLIIATAMLLGAEFKKSLNAEEFWYLHNPDVWRGPYPRKALAAEQYLASLGYWFNDAGIQPPPHPEDGMKR
jgi:hypothetical protein